MSDTIKSIGKILTGNEGRDAIHIAVVPIVAGHKLFAGQHIGVESDGRAAARRNRSRQNPERHTVSVFLLLLNR